MYERKEITFDLFFLFQKMYSGICMLVHFYIAKSFTPFSYLMKNTTLLNISG